MDDRKIELTEDEKLFVKWLHLRDVTGAKVKSFEECIKERKDKEQSLEWRTLTKEIPEFGRQIVLKIGKDINLEILHSISKSEILFIRPTIGMQNVWSLLKNSPRRFDYKWVYLDELV